MYINTIQNIKNHSDKDKVIELLEEAHKVHMEEFQELLNKIKITNKELAIHILEMQVLALSDDFKEIYKCLEKNYGENKHINSMFNSSIDEVEKWTLQEETSSATSPKGVARPFGDRVRPYGTGSREGPGQQSARQHPSGSLQVAPSGLAIESIEPEIDEFLKDVDYSNLVNDTNGSRR